MSRESSKKLRDDYRNSCGYTVSGGITTDFYGKRVDRYPSEQVIENFLQLASSHSAPLSKDIVETLHKKAAILVQIEVVANLRSDVAYIRDLLESTTHDSDVASKREEEAKSAVEVAAADYQTCLKALKDAEERMRSAVNAHASLKNYAQEKRKKVQEITARIQPCDDCLKSQEQLLEKLESSQEF
jgi:chromosome segregation ATPase